MIERDRLLARRGAVGAVYGRLGAGDGPVRWLYDETEGRGSLAIAVRFPAGAAVQPGDRAVVWGAWIPAGEAWEFSAQRFEKLDPGPPDRSPSESGAGAAPSVGPLTVSSGAASPEAVPVSQRTKPGLMRFAVLDAPDRFGDGWTIGDVAEGPPLARLFLPGERRPYGAQAVIARRERWSLDVGAVYEVEIGKFRPPRPGSPLVLQALGAPVRVDAP